MEKTTLQQTKGLQSVCRKKRRDLRTTGEPRHYRVLRMLVKGIEPPAYALRV
ncbi:hypothetical protein SAMN03159358_0142, partial [Paenibacillus sp. NFR01]